MTKPVGPIVLFSGNGDGSYTPSSHQTFEEALGAISSKDWFVTGAPLTIGVVKSRAPSKKTEKKVEPKK